MPPRQYVPPMIHLPQGVEMLLAEPTHEGQCAACHQTILLRPITLTKGVIPALRFLMRHPAASRVTSDDIKRECGPVAYATYTKIKYWGLIQEVDGGWEFNALAHMFLRGEIALPETMWVYNDHARIVPDAMLGRWVTINELAPPEELSRKSVAAASIPLSAPGSTEPLL